MRIFLIVFSLFLASCGSVNLQEYKDDSPEFSLLDFFQGETKAWGLVQDYSGKVTRRFTVNMTGTLHDEAVAWAVSPSTTSRSCTKRTDRPGWRS